jgi:hypothetical protein
MNTASAFRMVSMTNGWKAALRFLKTMVATESHEQSE